MRWRRQHDSKSSLYSGTNSGAFIPALIPRPSLLRERQMRASVKSTLIHAAYTARTTVTGFQQTLAKDFFPSLILARQIHSVVGL